MKSSLAFVALFLLAACAPSPTAPSQPNPLGANRGGGSLARNAAACFPRVQAPSDVRANQGGAGGSVNVFYTVDNGGDVDIQFQRKHAGSGLWEPSFTHPVYPPNAYGSFRLLSNGTYQVRVRQAGICAGDWSGWVEFGVEGMPDPEHNPVHAKHYVRAF